MTNITIAILSMFLLFSVATNFFFVWYLSRLTKTLMFFSENLNDLLDILTDFAAHVRSVYGLETFYGDETLLNLMQHGESVVEQMEKFEEIIYLAENEETKEDDVDEQELDPDEREASPSEEEAQEKKGPSQIRVQF
tara:strand:- start:781 stop:1191 length:411 start_codon:yes stop_codon:yes gene_type:complete